MVSRRHVLALFGCSISAFGGCSTGSQPPDETPNGTSTLTGADVPTETPGTPTQPSFKSVGLSTVSVQCGNSVDATITVEDTQLTVVGTIVAPTTCYHASLRSASIQGGTAELDIYASDNSTTEVPCEQCLSEVKFELTGTFVGGRPTQIVVELHGEKPETFRKTV
jgi:hypothetical protein